MNDHPHMDENELVAFLDGELPEDRAAWWRAHLETCKACATSATEIAAITSAVRQMPERAVDYNITIPQEIRDPSGAETHAAPARRAMWPLALAASLVLFFIAGYSLWNITDSMHVTNVVHLSDLNPGMHGSPNLTTGADLEKIVALYPPETPPVTISNGEVTPATGSAIEARSAFEINVRNALAFVGLSRIGDIARAQVLDLESGEITKVSPGDLIKDGRVAAISDEAMTVEFPRSGGNTDATETIHVAFPLANSDTLAAQVARRLTFERMTNLEELNLPLNEEVRSSTERHICGQFMVLTTIPKDSITEPRNNTYVMPETFANLSETVQLPGVFLPGGQIQVTLERELVDADGAINSLIFHYVYPEYVPTLQIHLAREGERVGPYELVRLTESQATLALGSIRFKIPLRRMSDSGEFKESTKDLTVLLVDYSDVLNEIELGPDGKPDLTMAMTRQAHQELRNLAVALESYYIDYNSYPCPIDANGAVILAPTPGAPVEGFIPRVLTTPISYLNGNLPSDPFAYNPGPEGGATYAYRYATTPITCWIVTSNGPDLSRDLDTSEYVDSNKAACDVNRYLSQYGGTAVQYDPTNGTRSKGDIIRTGP